MSKRQLSKVIEDRVLAEGECYLQRRSSIRDVAKSFGVSKSTVHQDLTQRLRKIDYCMWQCVMKLVDYNSATAVAKMNAVNIQTKWSQNKTRRCTYENCNNS